jgi:hypothetical protein
MAYLEKAQALAAIKELPAVRELPVAADEAFLNDLLTSSAGQVPSGGASDAEQTYTAGVTVYRHYYVAARFLETLRSQHVLSQGGSGIVFTGLATPIASLMALQQGIDSSLKLIVPAGFEASAVVAPDAAGAKIKPLPFGSGARRTTLTP